MEANDGSFERLWDSTGVPATAAAAAVEVEPLHATAASGTGSGTLDHSALVSQITTAVLAAIDGRDRSGVQRSAPGPTASEATAAAEERATAAPATDNRIGVPYSAPLPNLQWTGSWGGVYGTWEETDSATDTWRLLSDLTAAAQQYPSPYGDPWTQQASAADPWGQYSGTAAVQNTWQRQSWSTPGPRYLDKDPPPTWDGKAPETTWRSYRREFDQWLMNTDIPSGKHGMLIWRALSGDAKLLISHLTDTELQDPDIGKKVRGLLDSAHKHISEFEDQDDFDQAVYGMHRERNQSLLHFANQARSAFLKADAHGDPLPDRRKGMIFLRRAKIPGHLEDHIMARTGGSRNFSELLDAIRVLARRPTTEKAGTYLDLDEQRDDLAGGEEEAFADYDSEDGAWIPLEDGDLEGIYDEDDVHWALANFRNERGQAKSSRPGGQYGQARKALQDSRMSRGWKRPEGSAVASLSRSSSSGSGKGFGKRTPDKQRDARLKHISTLKARTRCRICQKVGHWGNECPDKPADGKTPAAGFAASSGDETGFFCGMMCQGDPDNAEEPFPITCERVDDDDEAAAEKGGGVPSSAPASPAVPASSVDDDTADQEWLARKRREAKGMTGRGRPEDARTVFQRFAKRQVVAQIVSDLRNAHKHLVESCDLQDSEREFLEAEVERLTTLRYQHRDLTTQIDMSNVSLPFEGADERMQRDVDGGISTREAYQRMRKRKRAEAKRIAGAPQRADERLELERQWHEKHDEELDADSFVPSDPFQGRIDEDVVEACATYHPVDHLT